MTATERVSGDFGRTLREARERRGISLRQIANSTKISVGVLDALERNDISRLPGGIFGRAFVRSYATEVGLDPEETIRQFLEEFPQESVTTGHPISRQLEDNQAIEGQRVMAATFLRLGLVSVPIAAVVLYLGASLRQSATSEQTAPRPPVAAPVGAPAGVAAIAPDEPSSDAAPQAPTGAQPVDPARSAAAGTAGERNPTTREAVSDRLTVGFSATRPCWISVTVDGRKAIERVLQVGELRTVDAYTELVVTAGDAAAISMTLNGAPAKPLGKSGEVVTARLNLKNVKDYLLLQ